MTPSPDVHPAASAHPLADLADRLGMPASATARLCRLPAAAADLTLPDDAAATGLMRWCAVDSDDRSALLAARPHPDRDPHWWWLLRATVAQLRDAMDQPLPAGGYTAWPTVPREAGPVGMWLYAWSLLTVVPDVLQAHRRRGVPEQVSRDSLAGLRDVLREHHQVTGIPGIGLIPLWRPPLTFAGADVTLGRLSFTRCELAVGDGTAGWVLQVHIPATGALVEAESTASFARAERFFAEHFPEQPVAAMVCISWVLDPQLTEYLAPTSNLLAFGRRFQLLPLAPLEDDSEGDREMMRLGLQLHVPDHGPLSEADLDRVPATTTLQRAFTDHVRSGRHWHKRTGILWRLT